MSTDNVTSDVAIKMQLMLAAPRLLAELKRAAVYVPHDPSCEDAHGCAPGCRAARAFKAISEAEGR